MLDVCHTSEDYPYLFTCDTTSLLSMLMSSLPHLTHLDISGTNLAGWVRELPVSHRPTSYTTNRWSIARTHLSWYKAYNAPAVGGSIKWYCDSSICHSLGLSALAAWCSCSGYWLTGSPGSICLSQPRFKHAGCVVQLPRLLAHWLLAAGRPAEMCRLRTHLRTDVDPLRVKVPSVEGHIVSPPPRR